MPGSGRSMATEGRSGTGYAFADLRKINTAGVISTVAGCGSFRLRTPQPTPPIPGKPEALLVHDYKGLTDS